MRVNIIGTPTELDNVIAVLRAGLDIIEVGQRIASPDGARHMVSVEAAVRLDWATVATGARPNLSTMRRILAELEPPSKDVSQRRPRPVYPDE